MIKYYIAIYGGALVTVIAQLLLKKGASGKKGKENLLFIFANGYVFAGYFLFILVTLLNLYGLQKVRLIEMIVVQPLVYLLLIIGSVLFFREKISKVKLLSIGIIIVGMVLFNL
jgi:drug/metabolite transporter (DMT)-like permease